MSVGYEPSRARGIVALLVGGAFVGWLAMMSLAVFGFYRVLERTIAPPRETRAAWRPPAPPAPRLQIDPQVDRASFRAQEDVLLTSYGWIDRSRGIVHVPLDKALDLYAAGSVPSAPAASSRPAGGRGEGAWERSAP